MKRAIFISYRRDDSEGEAGRLYDDLVRAFGDDSVFMDVAGIAPGLDFRKAIDDNVASCGVLLAIIGPHWASIAGENGSRRLDDGSDFVRLEIASALSRQIAVIPVLVHEARMPRPEDLPDNLKDLSYHNSVELTHTRWNSDVQLLTKALQQYVTTSTAQESDPVHATLPVQLPPPVGNDSRPPASSPGSKLPLVLGSAIVVLVALIAVLVYALTHRNAHKIPPPDTTAAVTAVQQASAAQPAASTPPADTAQQPANSAQPAPATAPAAATPPAATAGQANALAGNWRNRAKLTGIDTLVALRITGSGPSYNVEPMGQCAQAECSWGLRTIYFGDGTGSGDWAPRNTVGEANTDRTVHMTIQFINGSLAVQVQNIHHTDDPAKRRVDQMKYVFLREQ